MLGSDDDPVVPVDRWKLENLVEEKTPFTMREFELLIGWFFLGDGPASRRKLAWDTIQLSAEAQQKIAEVQAEFPQAQIIAIREESFT